MLNISGRMKVKTLRSDFKTEFGLTLRIYDGKSFADDDVTLASIRKGDSKGGDFAPRKNTKVGNLENKFMELFGIKVQVSGSDDSYLCNNDLTLAGAHEEDVKKLGRKEKKVSKNKDMLTLNDSSDVETESTIQSTDKIKSSKFTITLEGKGLEMTLGYVNNEWGENNINGDFTDDEYHDSIPNAQGDLCSWFDLDEIAHFSGPVSDEVSAFISDDDKDNEELTQWNPVLLLGTIGLPSDKKSDYILKGINHQSGEVGLFYFQIKEEIDLSRLVYLTVNLDQFHFDQEVIIAMAYVPKMIVDNIDKIDQFLKDISEKIYTKGFIDTTKIFKILQDTYGLIVVENEPDYMRIPERSVRVLSTNN